MPTIDLGLSATGYVILAILWCLVVIPLKRAIVEIVKSSRSWGFMPRIVRVPNCYGAIMVSGQRAAFRPQNFVRITPWCWRKR